VRPVLLAAAAALALAAGCGAGGTVPGSPSRSGPTGTVTVFAAASLTDSFGTLGRRFEAANPGVTVRFSFGASSALAQSIVQGAPADVFASASPATMRSVLAGGDAAEARTFARNTMQIAVRRGNPARVAGVTDLAGPGVKVALCQPQVPCGTVAQQVLAAAKVAVTPVTYGADVRAVLTAVRLGEVDAGMVYRTDVRAAGAEVTGIEIPAEVNASTSYPVAVLRAAPNGAAARAFVEYLLSPAGTAVLTGAGFARP